MGVVRVAGCGLGSCAGVRCLVFSKQASLAAIPSACAVLGTRAARFVPITNWGTEFLFLFLCLCDVDLGFWGFPLGPWDALRVRAVDCVSDGSRLLTRVVNPMGWE
eukprot:scaffold123008_cov39-Tisochrysis_lutea.AAC.1